MKRNDKVMLLGIVILALASVIMLTMVIGRNKKQEEPDMPVVATSIGDPAQDIPKEESVDVFEEEDMVYLEGGETLEAIPQDAGDATQEDLFSYWGTLTESTSSYEKVKVYDLLLTGFCNMIMRGEYPEIINSFPLAVNDYGFQKETIDAGGNTLDLYSVVLPASATISSSRASLLAVLSSGGVPYYSEYLVKKGNLTLDGAVVLQDGYICTYGKVLDQNYGSDEQLHYVKAMTLGESSVEPRSIEVTQGLGTIVMTESNNTLFLKSGTAGVEIVPVTQSGILTFVCSDGSETMSLVSDYGGLVAKITAGGEMPIMQTEDLLESVEIPQFN